MNDPEGWVRVQLGDVAEIALGKMLDRAKRRRGRPLPYLRNANVRWDGFALDDLLEMPFEEDELERYAVKSGDLLVCEGGEPGRAAIWPGGERDIKYQKALLRVRPAHFVMSRWLLYSLRRDALQGALEEYFTGSTIKHFPRQSVVQYKLLLPPLAEQRRIVEKIEELLTCLGAARDRLAKASWILKDLRQSILRGACSGDITADWRDGRADSEDGSDAALSDTDADALPAGWRWVSLDDLRDPNRPIIYGIIKPGPHVAGGIPYVRVVEMKDGHIDVPSLRRVSPDRANLFRRATLRAGDLLISKDGTIGRVAVVPPELEGGNITQHLVRLSPRRDVSRDYLVWAIRSPVVQDWLTSERKGVALQGVNVEDFRRLPIPMPPRAEQDEIVRRVDALFKLVDAADTRVGVAMSRCDKVTQAVLAKAFAGELVPTEAELARQEGREYEPASMLLEGLRTNRSRNLNER